MELEISCDYTNRTNVKQILKYYLSNFDDQVSKISISIERFGGSEGDQFSVCLNVNLNNGSLIEFNDIQMNIQNATQRTLDRLVRHLQFQKKRQHYLNKYYLE